MTISVQPQCPLPSFVQGLHLSQLHAGVVPGPQSQQVFPAAVVPQGLGFRLQGPPSAGRTCRKKLTSRQLNGGLERLKTAPIWSGRFIAGAS
jgi:hypothetical protein